MQLESSDKNQKQLYIFYWWEILVHITKYKTVYSVTNLLWEHFHGWTSHILTFFQTEMPASLPGIFSWGIMVAESVSISSFHKNKYLKKDSEE